MAIAKDFEELRIWQMSYELDVRISSHSTVERMKYDLGHRTQMLKSSGPCMDDITEGSGRGGSKELIDFLRIAKASIDGTRSQIIRAYGRKYIDQELRDGLAESCRRKARGIGSLIGHLRNSGMSGERYVSEPEARYGDALFTMELPVGFLIGNVDKPSL